MCACYRGVLSCVARLLSWYFSCAWVCCPRVPFFFFPSSFFFLKYHAVPRVSAGRVVVRGCSLSASPVHARNALEGLSTRSSVLRVEVLRCVAPPAGPPSCHSLRTCPAQHHVVVHRPCPWQRREVPATRRNLSNTCLGFLRSILSLPRRILPPAYVVSFRHAAGLGEASM